MVIMDPSQNGFSNRGLNGTPGIPKPDYIDKLLQIVRSDCQKYYYRLESFHKTEFQEKVITDFKELGGKFTYS